MKTFDGFPDKFEFTAVPKPFLAQALPLIGSLEELKASLLFFRVLYQKKGFPPYVTAAEIADLNSGLDETAAEQALSEAAARGTTIKLAVVEKGKPVALYFLNDGRNREAVQEIIAGRIKLGSIAPNEPVKFVPSPELPDIFSLYEQNIGLLTPIIAEELKEALKLYPECWVKDAVKEAASLNKRNWRYISKILENWATGGRNDGTYFGNPQKDPDKYTKGKYGKFVRR
ncbi:DnaD domain protein [Dehalogenimonas sp. 4OHTPN]|uniref:DnaD domain protein n=1 Tax=Dehalogenimonas sp. 4OHTPN TaxID=3166643 RepID=A0AAU8G8P0_9CHLR